MDKHYEVTNVNAGPCFGIRKAATPEDAIAAMRAEWAGTRLDCPHIDGWSAVEVEPCPRREALDRLRDGIHSIQRDLDHATDDTPENCARTWMLQIQVEAWRDTLDLVESLDDDEHIGPCPGDHHPSLTRKVRAMALADAAKCWRDT